MGVIFWASYLLLVFGMSLWVAKHPLSVGGAVLFLYVVGSVVVSIGISFVVGIFLFLTGVSGMMVAFLYVVALCPNPVFKVGSGGVSYVEVLGVLAGVCVACPTFVVAAGGLGSLGIEISSLSESLQWLRDPCMCGGLSSLMPFLGALLFMCMVSVVMLCGQQKQCLGGRGFSLKKRTYV